MRVADNVVLFVRTNDTAAADEFVACVVHDNCITELFTTTAVIVAVLVVCTDDSVSVPV